jgi:hypothetical protein
MIVGLLHIADAQQKKVIIIFCKKNEKNNKNKVEVVKLTK